MLRSVTQWHSEFRPVQYKLNCLSSTRSPSMSPYAGLKNACMSLATCLAIRHTKEAGSKCADGQVLSFKRYFG